MKNLVSIIIPCYNHGEYIAETLDSVLGQTYNNWEAIILNDGSTDNSAEIAELYTKKDNRITLVNLPNGGVAKARNYGISIANGEFILPLDSDDIIEPTYIEKAIDVFNEHPDVKVVYCQWEYFGITTKTPPLQYVSYKKQLLYNAIFCSALFRKEDAVAIGGYDEKLIGYEDWEFFIRLLDEDSIVYQIPERLFKYRIKAVSRNTEALNYNHSIDHYVFIKNIDIYLKFYNNPLDIFRQYERYERRNYHKQYRKAAKMLKAAETDKEAYTIVKEFAAHCRRKWFVLRIYMNYIKFCIFHQSSDKAGK